MLDNYDLWRRHNARQEQQIERLPVCVYCTQEIQDDFLIDLDGELYHEDCLFEQFRKPTEDYIE